MKNEFFLGVDVGTEGTKTSLFNESGQCISSSYEEYTLRCPKPGWAEQDPDVWWQAIIKNIKRMLKQTDISPENTSAIGVCGQMHAPVPIDEHGNVLYRSPPLWCDKRNVSQCEKLMRKINEDEYLPVTGNPITPAWMGIKVLWIKENLPKVYEKTHKFLTPKDYLIFRLTGEFSTDWSEASGSYLYDINKGDWSEELAEVLEIDIDKFPQIHPSHKIVGEVTSEAAKATGLSLGTPVVAGGGDFLCALLGAGVVAEGRAADISGTSSLLAFHSGKPLLDRRIMNLHHVVDGWASFNEVEAGLLRWFRDEFGEAERRLAEEEGSSAYKVMDGEAESVPAGAEGLILIPHFMGERVLRRFHMRGALIGLTLAHKRHDVIRAIMEGVTYELRRILEIIEERGLGADIIRFVGGGTASPIWRRIKADIYGKPVAVLNPYHGGALGVAILAMKGVGVVKDPKVAVDEMVSVSKVYKPNMKAHERYNKFYLLYKEIYEDLQPFYEKLHDIA